MVEVRDGGGRGEEEEVEEEEGRKKRRGEEEEEEEEEQEGGSWRVLVVILCYDEHIGPGENGQLQTLQRNVTTLAGRPGWAAADQGNSTADIWRNTVTGPLKSSKPHGRKKTVVWCAPPITARSQTRSGPNIHIRVTVHYATPSLDCRCPTPAPTDDGCSSSPGHFKFSAHGILQLVCWYRNTRSLLDH
ncbi:predicted protein [Coccidioides posadasii str. Silveira]|uniref:Predicted protein n=1 Tax=Coccidioides posadasii (strain RMSCC 757 / Silveira) TaxID=443226 RepID=E9DF30_COCPS|nr:predicted protein [Coccidioides posadasii str. Silveira]